MKDVKKYFDSHPQVEVFHFTSDGFAFEQEHHADAHSKTLKDRKVRKITRAEALAAEEEGKASEKPEDKKESSEKPEEKKEPSEKPKDKKDPKAKGKE